MESICASVPDICQTIPPLFWMWAFSVVSLMIERVSDFGWGESQKGVECSQSASITFKDTSSEMLIEMLRTAKMDISNHSSCQLGFYIFVREKSATPSDHRDFNDVS